MRLSLVVVVLLLVAAAYGSAAQIDPKYLVLHRADMPTGFELDRDKSGPRTNASDARDDPRLSRLLERWGRVASYQMQFDRGDAVIASRSDVFRSPAGPRLMLAYLDEEMKKSGTKGLRRSRVHIGAEGWLWGGDSSAFNMVAWRTERVFAAVVALGVGKARVLALARVQQRRIAAAQR